MARGRPLLKSPVQAKAEDQQLNFLPPKDAEYVRDWTMLAAGEEVYIVQENAGELSGRVDAVTEDGTILWVHLAGGAGRRLFTRSEGGHVWRVPAEAEKP